MGKVTIIIENPCVSTSDLVALSHEAMQWLQDKASERYGIVMEDIFVVPGDDEPYIE